MGGTRFFALFDHMFVGAFAWMLAGSAFALAAAPLAIERAALHQYEDGPLLAANHEFLPGETVFFSCRLKGYQLEKKEDEYQGVKLAWHMSVTDPAGVLLEKEASGRIDERVLPQDKNWLPKFVHTFLVPPFAPGGVYRISVKVKDEIGGTEAGASLDLHVRGTDVKPSDTLVARNFRFLRNEDDPAPLHRRYVMPARRCGRDSILPATRSQKGTASRSTTAWRCCAAPRSRTASSSFRNRWRPATRASPSTRNAMCREH